MGTEKSAHHIVRILSSVGGVYWWKKMCKRVEEKKWNQRDQQDENHGVSLVVNTPVASTPSPFALALTSRQRNRGTVKGHRIREDVCPKLSLSLSLSLSLFLARSLSLPLSSVQRPPSPRPWTSFSPVAFRIPLTNVCTPREVFVDE